MATYGENLKRLRGEISQEEIARRMGLTRQGNLSQYELDQRFPTPETVQQHATALGCQPWELLQGVETEYDRLRSGAPSDKNVKSAPGTSKQSRDETQAQVLLRRCENEQARVAATRDQLGEKVGEISKYITAQLGDLAAIVSRLPRRQAAMARGRGPGSPRNHKRRRRRDDQKRPPETPPD